MAADVDAARSRERERISSRVLLKHEKVGSGSVRQPVEAQVAARLPGGGVHDEAWGGSPLGPQGEFAADRAVLLVAALVGTHQEEDAGVNEHLEVFPSLGVHGAHRRGIHRIL